MVLAIDDREQLILAGQVHFGSVAFEERIATVVRCGTRKTGI